MYVVIKNDFCRPLVTTKQYIVVNTDGFFFTTEEDNNEVRFLLRSPISGSNRKLTFYRLFWVAFEKKFGPGKKRYYHPIITVFN